MLLKVSDDIQKALNKNRVIALILIDFFKAFDKIDHEKLLRLLFCLKFGNILIAIISSYLTNRKQYAQVNHPFYYDDIWCSAREHLKTSALQHLCIRTTNLYEITLNSVP